MPLQLLQVAQSSADALAVYRKPTSMHAVALLLLHQAAGRGSITSEDADAYLSNAVAHVHTLAKRQPASDLDAQNAGPLVWVATVFDACAAVERGSAPYL